jgi:hypothetical protein
MKRIVSSLLLLVLTVAPGLASDEAQNLRGLKQLRIVVADLHPDARAMDISGDTLESQLRTRLRREVPRLAIHRASHSYVYVRVTLLRQAAVPEQEAGCTTLLELQIHRPVTILNDELGPEVAVALVAVWEKSVMLGGSCGGAQTAIKDGLDALLRSLVADYSRANP